MVLPNFFIVGAPKCGTTALYSYLRQHPAVFMPKQKEPLFFSSDLGPGSERDARYLVRDQDAYVRLFSPGAGATRMGEASPLYMYSSVAARNIKQLCGEAKIIAMVRDPVDLMYAFHSQRLFTGNETIEDFAEALDAAEDRKQGRRVPRRCVTPEALWYREVATLSPQIERFLTVFDRSDVLVIVFDDLRANTPEVFRKVLQFLEIDDGFSPEFRVVNANRQIRSKWIRNALRNPPDPVLRAARVLMPRNVRRHLLDRVRSNNMVQQPRLHMDPVLRRRLQAEFAPEVERLGHLIGRDLTAWSRVRA